MVKQIIAYGLFILYHVAHSSIHIHHDHRLSKRFEENLYLGAEARNICRILRIQYFCDINIERVDPKVLNELIWFENPAIRPQQMESPFYDYESAIEDQYTYLRQTEIPMTSSQKVCLVCRRAYRSTTYVCISYV